MANRDSPPLLVSSLRGDHARIRTHRRWFIGAGLAFIVLSALAAMYVLKQQRTAKFATVTAQPGTLVEANGELRFAATLIDPPKGEHIPLTCQWRSFDGVLLHENAWETKAVNHALWETHCIFRDAPAHVTVVMQLDGRVIASGVR